MMRRVLRQRTPGLALVAARALSEAQIIRPVHKFEQFVRPENEEYVQELLKKFVENPNSVDSGWWPVLEALDQKRALPDVPLVKGFSRPKGGGPINEADETRIDNLKFTWMVRSFEQKGHLVAKLDPLGLYDADLSSVVPPELQPSFFGFTEAEMDKTFRLKRDEKGFTDGPTTVTLREVINELQSVYCANIGFEFTHLRSQEEQTWLRERILHPPAPRRTQSELLRELVHAEGFEKLLANKFTTAKRFGSEGAEAVIPMLRVLLEESADAGFDSAIFSMAHRGRLNILHNVLQKDLDTILCEFQYLTTPGNTNNLGDVKYHLGHEATIEVRGRKMDVRMLANPSHLECVQPVSQGVVKARQTTAGNQQTAALHVTLHGDAAYSGQGVCFETMAMAELASFDVGGTIHIITNNQVGFTTNPAQSRSAAYCSDLAKLNSCPVFHVNGDCPEDVIRVAQIATAYRATFKRDVIIDFVCYRRNGHNETDEPRFTQPLMYKTIDAHGTPSDVYARKLNVAPEVVKQMKAESMETYRKAFNAWESKIGTAYVEKKWVDPVLPEYPETAEIKALQETGVAPDTLRNLGAHLAGIPENFTLHKLVLPIIKKRGQSYATGTGIEWAAAEQLALASLITTGHGVRLSGQDIERATFSQRHYNLHDFNNGDKYNSLTTLPNVPAGTPVQIHNSLLSEFAVSAFEMGYSMQRPNDLVMWEAQFGDFANGAQIVWDNFLSGMEVKWGDKCGLVVSLPHGYDGQGPEHSSGRLERFLQLEGSDDVVPADFEKPGVSHYHLMESRIRNGNWQVAYATTAANYFHLLRRQVCRDFRKPLINFFSKQNLRLEESKSSFDEMAPGTRFQPVLDTNVPKARRVLFCSGQVSIGLRAATKDSDVAVVRLEQIAPFPWEQVAAVVDKYRAANPNVEFVWVQDEPRNMGAWNYIRPRFRNLLVQRGYSLKEAASMRYIGRAANGSPATGYGFIHEREQKQIIAEALAK